MRITLGTLVFAALAAPAPAGVYNLVEQHPVVPAGAIRGYILNVRSAAEALPGLPTPESFRGKVLHHVAELERDRADGLFTPMDRISLSANYLRLGRVGDALKLLLEEENGDCRHQANLASAYFLSGELEMAVRTQERVLSAWPLVQAGWSEDQRLFFRECERVLLRLFKDRLEETRQRKTHDFPVDPLFPGLRFVGPEGTYVAGGLSVAMHDRLPINGPEIVFQLCKWYPADMRLYWQLAELLNVHGQIEQAGEILDELVRNGRSGVFLDLPAHRRVLREALPAYRELQDPTRRGLLLSQLLVLPRPLPGVPFVGAVANAAGSCAAISAVPHFSREVPPDLGENIPIEPNLLARAFGWQHLFGTFALGFLFAALAVWQLQILKGRR